MDSVWLLIALLFGLLAQQVRLPPLVGFLLAGFVLNALGEEGGELLKLASDYGIYLLLFTVGLKLRLKEFADPAIGGGAATHMLLITLLGGGAFLLLAGIGFGLVETGDLASAAVIAFAFSFSSTVFAVKVFDERGESRARHAVIAIGILIIQDVIAVFFLLLAEQKMPSVWALGLLALPLFRPLLLRVLERAGHGEVLVLFGLATIALAAELFDAVGMKPGIGALVFGMLLGGHRKTVELYKALFSFKEFFLLGFFLSIGLGAMPTLDSLIIVAGLLLLLLPVKTFLYFWLLTRFHVRARTAFLSALSLACFSEFGLIVAREGEAAGLISADWMVVMALAVAGSFAVASVLNIRAHELYERLHRVVARFETQECKDNVAPADPGEAEVLVIGMGRVGRGAYRSMRDDYSEKVLGIDADEERVERLRGDLVNVISGDAEDIDFWRQILRPQIRLIMLALP
ncbi:MAG: cation:proton antiporter, partial [Gammaproteobacteria bacterium]|nr:cation:proton antiporter [Gammaproteobacteria bacterium]